MNVCSTTDIFHSTFFTNCIKDYLLEKTTRSCISGSLIRMSSFDRIVVHIYFTEDYAYDWQQWNVIQGRSVKNSGIIGSVNGEIYGEIRGPMWQMLSGWDSIHNNLIPKSWSGFNGCNADCRPMNLAFVDSTNITVANIRIVDSAFWTQLFRRCRNVNERNVHVEGATQYPNNDGLDIESCEVNFQKTPSQTDTCGEIEKTSRKTSHKIGACGEVCVKPTPASAFCMAHS